MGWAVRRADISPHLPLWVVVQTPKPGSMQLAWPDAEYALRQVLVRLTYVSAAGAYGVRRMMHLRRY